MDCPDTHILFEFVSGVLSRDQATSLDDHLDCCEACRKAVATARSNTIPGDSAASHETSTTAEIVSQRLEPGQLVDHFRIVRLLGRGGMSEVYLARDTKLGRKVALKLLLPPTAALDEQLRRSLREARATAQFNHQHIVTIHALGEFQGLSYLALEYLEGQTLAQRLGKERPSTGELLRIAIAMAQALSEAHNRHIVHGDLKPANVMITKTGRICVLDFGLARALPSAPVLVAPAEAPEEGMDLLCSQGHKIRGTPAYMAPEQWQGEVTGAVDVFALGIILYEMVAGRRPFPQGRPAGTAAVYAPLDSTTPRELAELVDKCLDKQPGNRPSAPQVVQRLTQLLSPSGQYFDREESPFRGLRPFDERHSHLFFGREEEIEAFLERLREEAMVAVVGAPGAGKSSFVRAGVIPRLRERGPLLVLRLRPGKHPFQLLAARILSVSGQLEAGEDNGRLERLAQELRDSPFRLNLILHQLAEREHARVVLFVDQLEELQTLVPERQVRERFMEALCGAADDEQSTIRIVVTMREEFLSRLAQGAGVRERLSHIMVLRSPSVEAIEQVLVRPVQALGYAYDDSELVKQMIADVQGEASCLPLLQFAGELLWRRRDKEQRRLSREAYQSIGGVAGALARHADGVLAAMDSAQAHVARVLLLRLVTPEGTRQILQHHQALEGLDPEQARQVLDRLTEARLITARQSAGESEPELELVHESLIAAWRRLARWIEESREELQFLAEIGRAAELWDKRGHRPEEVWQGSALREAERALERSTTEVPSLVLRFVAAGQRKEKLHSRRRRIGAAAAFATLALSVLVFAVKEHQLGKANTRAEAQRRQAEYQRAEVLREAARAALLRGDVLEARAKLRTSLETDGSHDSARTRLLWWQLVQDPLRWKRTLAAPVRAIDYSPDGELIAASSNDGSIYLLAAKTGALQAILRGHQDQVRMVRFSPDGRDLASSDRSGAVWRWQVGARTGAPLRGRHFGDVLDVSFSPDGKLLASGGADKLVRVWDLRTSLLRRELKGHKAVIHSISFAPDGRHVVSGSSDGELRVWELSSGTSQLLTGGHANRVLGICFSPDGSLLATAGQDGTARLWDANTYRLRHVLSGHSAAVYSAAFHPGGHIVATGSEDRSVRIWDLKTARLVRLLPRHDSEVLSVRFDPSGRYLVTASEDHTVRLWELDGWPRRDSSGHLSTVNSVSFSADGRSLASAGEDGTVRFWDVHTGEQQRVLIHKSEVLSAAFHPDGKRLASGTRDGVVRIWDQSTRQPVKLTLGEIFWSMCLSFSPDGSTLAVGGEGRNVQLWDVESGRQRAVLKGHTGRVLSSMFSSDGRLLATGGADQTVRLWDPHTGLQRKLLIESSAVRGVAFDPDGKSLATTTDRRDVQLRALQNGPPRTIGTHAGRVYQIAFAPDGHSIGSASSDQTAKIWDLRTSRCLTLKGHWGEVNTVQFSPDGKLVATGGDDRTVRLWDAQNGHPYWRAPALLASGWLYSHRGWQRLMARSAETRSAETSRAQQPVPTQWRRAIENRARAAEQSPGGAVLCIATFADELEVWDTGTDKQVLRRPIHDLQAVVATADGCVTRAREAVVLHLRSGTGRLLVRGRPTAIGWQRSEILVVADKKVFRFGPAGEPRPALPADTGVTAISRTDHSLILGYGDGSIELVSLAGDSSRRSVSLEAAPAAAFTRLLPGPMDLLMAGFGNGEVGIWSLQTGERLGQGRLHGAVTHLLLENGQLYAATELGAQLVWDLVVLTEDRCTMLREVWSKVPVVWEGGLPVVRPPPAGHPCR